MINKVKDIPDGTEVWVKMRRGKSHNDDNWSLRFDIIGESGGFAYLDDENEVLTEEQLRERFSTRIPKEGDEVEIFIEGEWVKSKVLSSGIYVYTNRSEQNIMSSTWRFPPKKTELTLAEVEEKLGIEKGSLIIKD